MFLLELRQAIRRLRHQPAFAIGVVAVLTLAIGANTAMFTLVNAIMLRPLPLREPDRLLTFTIVRPGTDRQPLSLLDLTDFKNGSRTLEGIASTFGWSANLTGSGDAERLTGLRVSADYFEITGSRAELGRVIQKADEQRSVALISHGIWQRKFGGSVDVIGNSLVLNGERYLIVGVLPPEFITLTPDIEVVVPYSPATDPRRNNRAQGFLRVVARMKPDVTVAQVTDDLQAIGRRLRDEYPDSHGSDSSVRVAALHDEVTGRSESMLRMLLAAVVLVLLVACANIASLFLVRGAERRRELAVRAALGASRGRLVRPLLVEAAVLGVTAGALGLLVSRALVDALIAIGPADLPRVAEVAIDLRVAAFTLAVALGASVLFGLVPALQGSAGDLRDGLATGSRSAGGGTRARAALIFAEVALSTVLLMMAALLARSFQQVQAVDPGFRAAHVLTIRLSLPRARYSNAAAIEQFYNQVAPRIASLPGVRAVGAANVVPMNGYLATTQFLLDGVVAKDAPEAHYRMVSPDYFRTLGIALRSGRAFSPSDRANSAPVAIVNETFVRQFFRDRTPVGTRLRLVDGLKEPREVEVVGVVGDVKHFGLERETTIEVYVPMPQVPDQTTIWLANNMYWVVRTEAPPLAAAEAVRREIATVDPAVPASFVRSMDQWMAGTLAPRRFNLQLVEAFAVAALLLAVVGIYAMSSSAVASRTREIGIRAALGASRRQVIGLVLRGGLTPVLAGLAAGAAVAIAAGQAVSGMLFGVSPADPTSLAVVVATLAFAALAASYLPARRAAKVDPMLTLRID